MVILIISSYLLLSSLLVFGTNRLTSIYINQCKQKKISYLEDQHVSDNIEKMETPVLHVPIQDKDKGWGWFIDIDH